MSWLEKLGLVEAAEPIEPVFVPVEEDVVFEVDASISDGDNVVEDFYAKNDLSDRSNSIYTVQALIATLPAEMTTAKKQSTVAGILGVQGIAVDTLVEDAKTRVDTLLQAKAVVLNDRTYEIESNKAEIESLKQAIEEANIRIRNAEEIIAATEQAVGDEVKVIDGLVEFCAGMEVK